MVDPADAAKPIEPAVRVENAAAALDTYEGRVISAATVTHRQSPLLATTLIRELTNDLADYADHLRIDFDAILSEIAEARAEKIPESPTRDHPYRVGSEVELQPDTARSNTAGAPARRGYVTAIEEPTDYGESVYVVRFPGIPAGDFHLTASNLQPASSSFPTTTTRSAIIRSAAQAERNLVTVAARMLDARRSQRQVDLADVTDRALLAEILGHWTGTSGERVLLSLGQQISRAAAQLTTPAARSAKKPSPAELAKADFPRDISGGLPTAETSSPESRPSRSTGYPKPQP